MSIQIRKVRHLLHPDSNHYYHPQQLQHYDEIHVQNRVDTVVLRTTATTKHHDIKDMERKAHRPHLTTNNRSRIITTRRTAAIHPLNCLLHSPNHTLAYALISLPMCLQLNCSSPTDRICVYSLDVLLQRVTVGERNEKTSVSNFGGWFTDTGLGDSIFS